MTENTFTLENQMAQYFSDSWLSQCKRLSIGQKDLIGIAYMRHILGVDQQTIDDFLHNRGAAYNKIGMKQSAIPVNEADYEGFWQEVARIVPNTYSKSDLSWLIANAGAEGVLHMKFQIDVVPFEKSAVLRKLGENAHAYK